MENDDTRYQKQILNLTITPSKIRDLVSCPNKFRLLHMDKSSNKFTPNDQMVFGNLIHAILQNYYDPTSDHSDVCDPKELVDRVWNSFTFSNDSSAIQYYDQAADILEFYLRNPKYKIVLSTEQYLSRKVRFSPSLSVNLSCKVDRLDILGEGSLEMIDYKVNQNGNLPTENEMVDDLSLFLYFILLRVCYPTYSSIRLTYENIVSLKAVSVEYSDKQMQENKRRFISLLEGMQDCIFPPKPSALCNWCPVSDLCEINQEIVFDGFPKPVLNNVEF